MTRAKLDPVGERQKPLADAAPERLREFTFLAMEIGPADGAYQQRVAGEDQPGILAARRVGDEQTGVRPGVSRGRHDHDPGVAQHHLLVVPQRLEVELDRRPFRESYGCTRSLRELECSA